MSEWLLLSCENIGAGMTVEISYVRTNITFSRAREMPFRGRQDNSQLFCLVQKPFKLIFCLRQDLNKILLDRIKRLPKLTELAASHFSSTSSVGSSIKVRVFISTVRPCNNLTSQGGATSQIVRGTADGSCHFKLQKTKKIINFE